MAGKNVLNEGYFGHKPSSVMIIYTINEYFKKTHWAKNIRVGTYLRCDSEIFKTSRTFKRSKTSETSKTSKTLILEIITLIS